MFSRKNSQSHPTDLDLEYYRKAHRDLARLSDEKLRRHYETYGIKEGRRAARGAIREEFHDMVGSNQSVLEIGPFCRPFVQGDNVDYFDVLDKEGLEARAQQVGYPFTSAPVIRYVSSNGDLSIVDKTYSAFVSSHCIEHQPDLVYHLTEVFERLENGGAYYVLVPDKRYCFDHFIAPSTIADIVDAYSTKRRIHSLRSVIEHRALTTHNDCKRHWSGDHADPGYAESIFARTQAAQAEFAAADGGYIDVHAWQFTPVSFAHILKQLFDLSLTRFRVEQVTETPRDRNEFTAILRKSL